MFCDYAPHKFAVDTDSDIDIMPKYKITDNSNCEKLLCSY